MKIIIFFLDECMIDSFSGAKEVNLIRIDIKTLELMAISLAQNHLLKVFKCWAPCKELAK